MAVGKLSGQDYYDTVRAYSKQNNNTASEYSMTHYEKAMSISDKKRLLTDKESVPKRPQSIIDSTLNYGKQIRESRIQSQSTTNEVKKLKYNFKDVSSQIRRAKTSTNAKQVASKARREVVQLKAKLLTGKYDTEELEAAIDHAKAMERAAKKKARHLEEEELIKITDKSSGTGLVASELEEKLENEADEAIAKYEEELEENSEELEEITEEQMAQMEEMTEEMTESMGDIMSDMMEDMVEDTLSKLMDGMMIVTDFEMTDDEFKAYKQKHRASEDKAMLEADAKYLKAIFDMYSKRMGEGGTNINIGAPVAMTPISVDLAASIPNIVDVSV